MIGSHVNHIVDMACLTEFQKLENLIYLETGAQLIIAIVSTISWIGKTSTFQGEEKAYPLKGNIGPRRGCMHGMHESIFATTVRLAKDKGNRRLLFFFAQGLIICTTASSLRLRCPGSDGS